MMTQTLLKDIFQYAEKMTAMNRLLLASSIFLGLSLSANVVLVLLQPSAGSILIIFALGWFLHQLLNDWQSTRNQLSMFNVDSDEGAYGSNMSIAMRSDSHPFYPVPKAFIQQAEQIASVEICQIIERYADDFSAVKTQKQTCERLHQQLTNHDAANLLLMALSLRERGHE